MHLNNFDLNEINDVLQEKYRDQNHKEIGDRVTIIDFSSTTHIDGRELDFEFDDDEVIFNFNTELIVIQTRQNNTYDVFYTIYQQNIIVVDCLTNKQYRTFSGHLKLIK